MRFLVAMVMVGFSASPKQISAQSAPSFSPWCESHLQEFSNRSNAPGDLWRLMNESGVRAEYDADVCTLNPWFVLGDFDSDGQYDFMVMMRRRDEPEESRLVVFWGAGKLEWIDGSGYLKFPYIDTWWLLPSTTVLVDLGDGPPPTLQGDGVMVGKLEAGGRLLYWDGVHFSSWGVD